MPRRTEAMPLRADAARNREKILAGARSAFAEMGTETSMNEVARRAGVGMATLYRNFPGRVQLLEALYASEVEAVCAAAESVAGAPGVALTTWLRSFFNFVISKQPIGAQLLEQPPGKTSLMSESRARVTEAARPLLLAAQQAGDVRTDVSLDQMLDLVVAIASVPRAPEYLHPMLEAALDGLTRPS